MDVALVDETDAFDVEPVQRDLSELGVGVRAAELDRIRPGAPKREAWLDWTAWHAAFAKVRQLDGAPARREPADLEVAKERRALAGEADPPGPLYDGPRLMEALHGPLPEALQTPGRPVVVLSDRLVGTFEGGRYHVRFLVAGHPTIVSPPGFVDGPARDRSFYVAKQALGSARDADRMVDDDHLTRGDDRLPTCVASALLQALAYADLGDPFCEDGDCRLYNPHWQEELLATMARRRLCERHREWIRELEAAPAESR